MSSNKGFALITGASTGIGLVYADRLAKRGYNLILVARSADKLEAAASQLRNAHGRVVEVVGADLGQRDQLAVVEKILRDDARISMLVNNAGVGSTAPVLDSDPDKMSDMISLNVNALTRLTLAAAPGFANRGAGTIINIASIVAIAPEMLNGVYGGTKAFVLGFSQNLKAQLGDKGVQIHVVLPGATATPFWAASGTPVEHLPKEIVMPADEMVDAALAGMDQGEFVTIPSLPAAADWEAYETARQVLMPNLSKKSAATRFGIRKAD